ncbi:MAG: YitT family protein [Ruminococcaceae bacterium]|nr:YitT family protein [Oscillospiraceae bacterium]
MKKRIWEILFILSGSLIFSLSVVWVASPVGLVTGGVSGVGIVVKEVTGGLVPIFVTSFLLNVPLFVISLIQRGASFIAKSLFSFLVMTVFLALFEYFAPPFNFEGDLIISTLIYGVLAGVGLGLILRSGAVSGGTDMLASIIKYRHPHLPISRLIVIIDVVIIGVGAFVFGLRISVYAIVALVLSAKIIDLVISSGESAKAVFIVSVWSGEIASRIFTDLKRGATEIDGKGMYTGTVRKILFTVVSKNEIPRLREIVSEIDSAAFVTVTDTRQVLGKGFEKIAISKDSLS